MEKTSGLTLNCRRCGKTFAFTESEQEFYRQKGFAPPLHCKECRLNRKSQAALLCSKCGTKVGNNGSGLYCGHCLENVELEFELKARTLRNELDEAGAKLAAAESEKAQTEDTISSKISAKEAEKNQLADELTAKLSAIEAEKAQLVHQFEEKMSLAESEKSSLNMSLEQEKQATASFQEQLIGTRAELEKALKHRATIDGIEPALRSIDERLEALERVQNAISQAMLHHVHDTAEGHTDKGLPGILGKIFRPGRKS